MVVTTRLVEIRWHGRGGQGAVTSAELLARAAINEGKYAQAFPSFGPERRGAPVMAFNRIDPSNRIRVRADVDVPDVVIVLDPTLTQIVNVTSGLKDDGLLVINTSKGINEIKTRFSAKWQIASVDATRIARDLLGVPIVNTTMLGVLIRATGVVNLDSLEEPIVQRFGRIAERNINAMKRAYEETEIRE